MKHIFWTVILLFSVAVVFAQSPLTPGETQFNLGVGFSNFGSPVYAGLDFGLGRDVSLGAEVSYKRYRESYSDNRWNHNVIGVSGNLNYHFNYILQIPSDWDFYAGVNVGFYVVNSPNNYPGSYKSELGLGGQLGMRYFFTNSFGVNLEVGGGNAFAGGKIGVTLKL